MSGFLESFPFNGYVVERSPSRQHRDEANLPIEHVGFGRIGSAMWQCCEDRAAGQQLLPVAAPWCRRGCSSPKSGQEIEQRRH
jgi:hypothetical protein